MKTLLLGLFLLAVSGAMAQNNPEKNQEEKQPEAHIEFVSTTHDFGQIPLKSDATCEFEFTNTGDVPLILSNVKASCGCTVPEWTKEPVLPGEKGVIKVKYTTVNRPNVIKKSILVMSNADNNRVILRIQGEVVANS